MDLIILRERLNRTVRKLGKATATRNVNQDDVDELRTAINNAKATIDRVRAKYGRNPVISGQIEKTETYLTTYVSMLNNFEQAYSKQLGA